MKRSWLTRRAAMTAVIAPPAFAPAQETGKPGHAVVHFEIGCRDRGKSQAFFSDLFGWKMREAGPATLIDAAERGIGGHITSLGHEPLHYTIFYVEVEDVQSYLNRAVTLGGEILVPPVKIPTGTFAWFADIDGNTIGLIQSKA